MVARARGACLASGVDGEAGAGLAHHVFADRTDGEIPKEDHPASRARAAIHNHLLLDGLYRGLESERGAPGETARGDLAGCAREGDTR